MKTKRATEEERRQAQDLAYRAMESYDPEEVKHLCGKALLLDPRCTDALVMAGVAFDDVDERIYYLSQVVRVAEEDLGGDSFLKENRGHFWGMLETRPYMRARHYLAESLRDAGYMDKAIDQYEAMLDLNPGDNQGVRYDLMGLYLESGNLTAACDLQRKYDDEPTAVFAWSSLLERLLSGDMDGAERGLARARKINHYVEHYLLSRKAMPPSMPDRYGFGDENEAIICMTTIGAAWKQHPEAVRWLHEREAPMETLLKIGRNDPCPCGSGKKYKKCCLDKKDSPSFQVGNPIVAEIALNEIMREMEGKNLSSEEELQAYLEGVREKQNCKPKDDFEGLSSEQMYRLINFPFESPEVVEFPSVLSQTPSAPISTLFTIMAEAIGEKGLKPTATGNLPRKVVQDAALAYWGEAWHAELTQYTSIRGEVDCWELHVARLAAELAGLIRKYKGKFILSRECRRLLKEGGIEAVYPVLLRSYAGEFNWGYSDGYPDATRVETFFAYTLYLLSRYGDQWRDNKFYEDAFLRAFPQIPQTLSSEKPEDRDRIIRRIYTLRCLERFAKFFGLVEIEGDRNFYVGNSFKLRKTSLLDDAVRFEVR